MYVWSYNFLPVSTIITFGFFLLAPKATPLNFSIPRITTEQSNIQIRTELDASVFPDGLKVTRNEAGQDQRSSTGRASFVEHLHLWDKASRNLTDFTTHFSFEIDSLGQTVHGDGLAFFLLPSNITGINITAGGSLGLPIDPRTFVNTSSFVAVEFDTFYNPRWDPNISLVTHVGININSLTSVNYSGWYSNIPEGVENEAWITYNSSTKILKVEFTGFRNGTRVQEDILSYVDLRDYLPEWVTVGFSASTGSFFERHNVRFWEFSSNNVPIPPAPTPGPKTKVKALVVGLSVGLGVLVCGLGLVGFGVWKKRSRGQQQEEEDGEELALDHLSDEFEKGRGPKKFSYDELARATNNFSDENKLGQGGFGGVYRGILGEPNSYIAVKRVSKGSKQGLKEYASEVKIISQLRHRNLVQLIGWCHEKRELILVYEFMPNGSLDLHLFKGKSLLTWARRYKIVQGLASALLYLHDEWEQCVVHRDIKSSNIMLDSNFNAKLGDFGLARLVDHEKGPQTTMLAGTMGYMAPEYVTTGKASKQSDVYSFGVVALEIASRRKPFGQVAEDTDMRTVEWIWDLYGTERLLEAADSKLCGEFDEQETECLMIVGLWCAHPDTNFRPSIKQAIQVLNFEAPLPILPRKMPLLTYHFLPPSTYSSLALSSVAIESEISQVQSSSYSNNIDSSKFTTPSSAPPSASLFYNTEMT